MIPSSPKKNQSHKKENDGLDNYHDDEQNMMTYDDRKI